MAVDRASTATASGRTARLRPLAVLYVAGLGAYLGGLLLWLVIGLLPTLARNVATVHGWVLAVAGRPGFWRVYAARVLHPPMTMVMAGASGGTVAAQYLFSVLNLLLGLILVVRVRTGLVPRLLAFALLGTAATFNHPSHQLFDIVGQPPAIKVVHFTFHIVSGVTYLWAVVLFPDGTMPWGIRLSTWPSRLVVVGVTAAATVICWRSSFVAHPQFFVVFFGVVVTVAGLAAQIWKVRYPANAEQRQQARLLRAALFPALLVALGWLGAWVWVHAATTGVAGATNLDHRLAGDFPAVFAVVPVMLFIGLLRYRLWDLDIVVSRALLYTGAVVVTSLAYVGLVTAAGAVNGTNAATAVVAMAAAGLVVLPVYRWLRRAANRLAFGQTLEPAEAMRALADGLEHLGPEEELQELTRVVVAATRAVGAQVWLQVDDELVCAAQAPAPADATPPMWRSTDATPSDGPSFQSGGGGGPRFPIRHDGQVLGALEVTLPRGVGLPPADLRLVTDLAAEAGLLVRNARIAAELARHVERLAAQAIELRRTRQQVVEATDRERRRLERDLHDGAQQDLVALILGLRMLRPPVAAEDVAELAELVDGARATLDVLCRGVLPAALAAGGLGPGLSAATELARRNELAVTVAVDVPVRPPPDIEGAVYFCCLEAVQNAAKHARASAITVGVTAAGGELSFAVSDDGAGFAAVPDDDRSGLRHLSERVAVLGGRISVRSAPGAGTTVSGTVPLGPPGTTGPAGGVPAGGVPAGGGSVVAAAGGRAER